MFLVFLENTPLLLSKVNLNFSSFLTISGNLRAHVIRVHNLEVPSSEPKFDCEECSCSFRKLGSLNAHVSKFHIPIKSNSEQAFEAKDLLSQALHSTGLTKDPTRNDLTATEELKGHMVLADKDKDGKVRCLHC